MIFFVSTNSEFETTSLVETKDFNIGSEGDIFLVDNAKLSGSNKLGNNFNIKAKKIKKSISDSLKLKPRSSYDKFLLAKDKQNIKDTLKSLGYYSSTIKIEEEITKNNTVLFFMFIKIKPASCPSDFPCKPSHPPLSRLPPLNRHRLHHLAGSV